MGSLTSFPSAVVTDDSALGGAILEKSLRFSEAAGNEYLSRTPSSASNQKTYTFSCWYRRSRTTYSLANVLEQKNNGQNYAVLYFQDDDKLNFHGYTSTGGNQYTHRLVTTQVFRDANSWFHIVVAVDTTQSTADDRVKIYVNGTQITNFDVIVNPSQNFDTFFNSTQLLTIGRGQAGSAQCYDGYMAELNFVDGFQLTPSSFGYTEFQTGIWRPKGYFGSYGTNGFRLDFSDNSAATAVTLGKDRSGQGNDFTPNNFSVSAGINNDSFLESPTVKKEFPTFNSNLQKAAGAQYRNGNYSFYSNDDGTVQTRANMSRNSGKWYAEFTLTTYTFRSGSYPYIGVAQAENFSNTWVGQSGTAYNGNGHIYRNGSQLETGHATYTQGDVISVAINLDSSPPQVWWAKNGTYIRSGNPATGAAGVNIEPASTSGTYTFTASLYANPGQWDANFGQRPFVHSIPAGYKTLNTDNFSINTPTIIRPQKHFKPVIYSGNNAEYRKIPLEFKPDLLWFKRRDASGSHVLSDTVTGITKHLTPNDTSVQGSPAYPYVSYVEDNGFILRGSASSGGNVSGRSMVAWCWKGGGNSNTFNVDGKGYASASAAGITEGNLAITGASINREAGFSIVKFTANNNASATIGHGLNSKPKFVIVKDTANSDDWQCKFIDDNMYVPLNDNNAGSTSYGNYTATDTLINLGYTWNNGSGKHIAYSWTNIPGYSKIGKYSAGGGTATASVHTGFSPAFILLRPTSNFGGSDQNYSPWGLCDSTRATSNVVTYAGMLTANMNSAEQVRGNGSNDGAIAAFDILSDGFKIRGSSYETGYNGQYFFMAFAEKPGNTPFDTEANAQ